MKRKRLTKKFSRADIERFRGRIELGAILNRLGDVALGLESMKNIELQAAKILLDKTLPDLSSTVIESNINLNQAESIPSDNLNTLIQAIASISDEQAITATDTSHLPPHLKSQQARLITDQNIHHNQQVKTLDGGTCPPEEPADGGAVCPQGVTPTTAEVSAPKSIPSVNVQTEALSGHEKALGDIPADRSFATKKNSHKQEPESVEKPSNSKSGLLSVREAVKPAVVRAGEQEQKEVRERVCERRTPLRSGACCPALHVFNDKSNIQGIDLVEVSSVCDKAKSRFDAVLAEKGFLPVFNGDLLQFFKDDIYDQDDSGGGDADCSQHESFRKGRYTEAVKGSFIEGRGIGKPAKIR